MLPVIAAVVLLSSAAASTAATRTGTGPPQSPVIVPAGPCSPTAHGLIRPKELTFPCGQWNYYFTAIAWRDWNATSASGTAVVHANLCGLPLGCAGGKYRSYRAAIRLAGVIACSRSRSYASKLPWRFDPHFTRLVWSFVGSKPTKWDRHIALALFGCE